MNFGTFVIGSIATGSATLVAVRFTPSVIGPFRFVNLTVAAIVFAVVGVLGLQKNDVGFNAGLLIFGARVGVNLGEGWFWVGPLPFIATFRTVDMKNRVVKLDPIKILTMEEVGAGGREQEIEAVSLDVDEGIIFFRVNDASRFLGFEVGAIERGLDDFWDETQRILARTRPMNQVLGSEQFSRDVGEKFKAGVVEAGWPVDIVTVPIPSLRPDQKVLEALEKQRVEKAERDGEIVELDHVRARIRELMQSPPDGPGFTALQALEVVQTERGKVKKEISEKKFVVDEGTLGAVQNIAGAIAGSVATRRTP